MLSKVYSISYPSRTVLLLFTKMSGRKKDGIWQHFDEVKGDKWLRAKCKKCQKEMQGIVARLKTHWDKCVSITQDEVETDEPEGIQPDKRSAPFKDSETAPVKRLKSEAASNMKSFVTVVTAAQKEVLDKQVARFVYATNSSFNSVEHKEFKAMIEKLNPGYKPPNRGRIANDLLDTVYKDERTKVRDVFENQMVCLSMDGWSNIRNEPIVAACIINKNGNTCLADTIDTSGNHHVADYLETVITETIKKVEHDFHCEIGSVVTDNAPNMAAMRNNISRTTNDIISYGCSAHILNLLAKDLENPAATKHVINIIKYFRNNQFAKAKLSEISKSGKLVMPLEVRWNTMCDALQSYVDNWIYIVNICEEFKDDIDSDVKKLAVDINIKRNAEHMLKTLKPIAISLTQIEANACTIGDAVLVWKNLQNCLKTVLDSSQFKLFNKRYSQAITAKHFVAFMLTPKFYCDTAEKLSEKEKEDAFEYLQIYGNAGVELTKKILCLELRTAPFTGTLVNNDIMGNFDALNWWDSLQSMKQVLSKDELRIIHQHLTAVASSASIERVFSTFGFVHSKIRNALGVDKAAKLVFLHRQFNAN